MIVEDTDKGDEGLKEETVNQQQQLPKDILFFMRDQESQTKLKQVLYNIMSPIYNIYMYMYITTPLTHLWTCVILSIMV